MKRISNHEAMDILAYFLDDEDKEVRKSAEQAMSEINKSIMNQLREKISS